MCHIAETLHNLTCLNSTLISYLVRQYFVEIVLGVVLRYGGGGGSDDGSRRLLHLVEDAGLAAAKQVNLLQGEGRVLVGRVVVAGEGDH